MQAVMHQLLSMGAVNGLPEDLQWAIRMLLPRKEDAKTAAAGATTKTTAAEAALSQLVPSTAYLPYLLQPQQLAVLTQHAQQVGSCTLLACACLLSLHLLVIAMLRARNVHVWLQYSFVHKLLSCIWSMGQMVAIECTKRLPCFMSAGSTACCQ